jgi:hypothetical protein
MPGHGQTPAHRHLGPRLRSRLGRHAAAGVWAKTPHCLEQSVAHWVLGAGATTVMVPALKFDAQVLPWLIRSL